ncbi:MAG: hypothetical protein WCX82_00650 [archaeon]|jgi:uncharacterized protein (UPF0333 family)
MLNKKGQLAIELIILLAIFLLFFQSMILPSIEFSENVLKDTQAIVLTKKNIDSLSSNIEQLASQEGYGKRQVYFYLPNNTTLDCNATASEIDYTITISKQNPIPTGCDSNGVCNFKRDIYTNQSVTCDKIGPGYRGTVEIQKTNTGEISIIPE